MFNFVEDSGWEECVYVGLTYLKSQVAIPQEFSNLDPVKLRKAIKSTLDKVAKPNHKIPSGVGISSSSIRSTSSKLDAGPTDSLVGNEITERMTSARGTRVKTRRKKHPLASIPEPIEG